MGEQRRETVHRVLAAAVERKYKEIEARRMGGGTRSVEVAHETDIQ